MASAACPPQRLPQGITHMAFVPDYRTPAARPAFGAATLDAGLRAHMLRVFNWMTSGLLVTGIVAYAVSHTSLRDLFYHAVPTVYGTALRPTALGMLSIFAPLAFVLVMSFGVNRLSRQAAQALFWAFCAAMGVSLTSIFLLYTETSVVRVFSMIDDPRPGVSMK